MTKQSPRRLAARRLRATAAAVPNNPARNPYLPLDNEAWATVTDRRGGGYLTESALVFK